MPRRYRNNEMCATRRVSLTSRTHDSYTYIIPLREVERLSVPRSREFWTRLPSIPRTSGLPSVYSLKEVTIALKPRTKAWGAEMYGAD